MIQRPLPVLLIIFLLIITAYACTDSATDGDSGPAVIEGRVESVSASESEAAQTQDVEGAVVTVAQINSDGSPETIGGAEAETDSQGEFTLEIPGESLTSVEADARIIIVAESDEGTGKAFITSDVTSGSTARTKPVTVESTVEANVLQQVVGNGNEGIIENADIESAVEAEVSASLEGNSNAVTDLVVILVDQAEIKSEFYASEGVEISEEQEEDIDQIESDAQVELENSLYDLGDSAEEQQNAFENFLETIANAELEAGIEASAEAKASELASRIVINRDVELSDEAIAEIYRINSFQTAVALDIAVRNQLEAVGSEAGTISIAEDAGSTLQTEIRNSIGASVEETNSLFADYSSEVVTAIENDASVDGDTFSTVNDIIGGEGGAIAAFESAVEGISDPGIIVDAYTDLYSDVRSTVDASFPDEETDNAEAYTDLIILLNIAS